MSKVKRKDCLYYVVLQNGVWQNGHANPVIARFHVGAKSEKEAIALCKEVVDSKASFHVSYQSSTGTLPRRTVINMKGSTEPFHEIDGILYLETNEYRALKRVDSNNEPKITIQRKYVKRYARGSKHTVWFSQQHYCGHKEINQYYQIAKDHNLPLPADV